MRHLPLTNDDVSRRIMAPLERGNTILLAAFGGSSTPSLREKVSIDCHFALLPDNSNYSEEDTAKGTREEDT